METETEVLYGNRFTCALVHSDKDLENGPHVFSLVPIFSFCVQPVVSNVLNILHPTVFKICMYEY